MGLSTGGITKRDLAEALAPLADRLDRMEASNKADHAAIGHRLDGVEVGMKVVSRRLEGLENNVLTLMGRGNGDIKE